MEIAIKRRSADAVLSVSGKLTATKLSDSLRGHSKELFDDGVTKLIIDMQNLIHIDSTGIGELVAAYTSAANSDAELLLARVPDEVKDLLEATNLLDVFDVLPEDSSELNGFD
jgi:anti-sigma B factor antagonist